eukprot:GHRQ01010364.1.p1 GENE.GHRQ01010364.1~~GHRQ01010364.1.p1  ORF type:complete len:241 (+),score=41.17 GHRQ01010364.1:575-1297(+)
MHAGMQCMHASPASAIRCAGRSQLTPRCNVQLLGSAVLAYVCALLRQMARNVAHLFMCILNKCRCRHGPLNHPPTFSNDTAICIRHCTLQIERIDDSTFRCYVGKLAFLGFSVEPVITVSVVVEERGCTIKLLSAKLQGSQLVEDLNKKFTAQMTNVVRWSATEDAAVKQLASTTTIEVVVQVPGWAGLVPVPSVEAAGSRVMQTTLNLMVPRFLEQLSKDYQLWASGDNSRKPLSDASL